MSDPIVADVQVREQGGKRITTITVIEGRGGDVWPARATSVPPVVRDELRDWLGPAETPSGDARVSTGADLAITADVPGVDAQRIGFAPTSS